VASSPSSRQLRTIARVEGIDATAKHRVADGFVFIEYVPRWEKGRVTNGEYRANPNPQRIVHVITEDGKIHGWGFGPSVLKLTLPAGETVTTAEDMASVLKARVEARKPVKETTEATPEAPEKPKAKAPAKKAAPKKRNTTGVQVVAN
jgi:hypothetical protein